MTYEEYLKKRNNTVDEIAKKYGLYVEVNQEYIDAFINGVNGYASSAEEEFNNMNYSNSSSVYKSRTDNYKTLSRQAKNIQKWLRSQSRSEEYSKYFDEATSNIEKIYKAFHDKNSVYSSFKSEEEYNKWNENQKWLQEIDSIPDSEDFGQYSQAGANVENPSYEDTQAPFEIFGWKPFGDGEEVKNIVTFAEANFGKALGESATNFRGGRSSYYQPELLLLINQFMEPEEKAIYNYYIGKGETEKANEYITRLTDTLRQRQAGKMVEQADGKALELVFSAVAGLDQFASGIKNIGNFITGDEADSTSSIQYAQSEMSSNNKGVWKVTNDVFNTTANMLPSILAGAFTGGVGGIATMTGSAVGNSYAEMRNLGYNEWQSRGYATLVGASEALLEKFIGGFSSIGGKHSLSAATKSLVSGIDNALARFAIQVPLNMASEGLEEGLQTVLEPAFKVLMTGEAYEAAEWSDIIYSGLLGALSAGAIEGTIGGYGAIGSSINAHKYKNIYGADSQSLVTEALEIDPENTHAKKMQEKLNKGKSLSGYNIGHLVESNEQALVSQDKGKIKAKAAERLAYYGETGNIDKIAEVITKITIGEKITIAEKNMLKNSEWGMSVLEELDPDKIKANKHISDWDESNNPDDLASSMIDTDWTEDIGTERINADLYNKDGDKTTHQPENNPHTNIIAPDDKEREEEKGTEAEIEAPANVSESIENVLENVSPDNIPDVDSVDSAEAEEDAVSLDKVSKKYGAQAQAMIHTYVEGQNVAKYDKDYQLAYDMGMSGVSLSYALNSDTISYITENQVKLAYEAGKAAADTKAKAQDAKNKQAATGKTGRRKGTVQGRDVKIEDLRKTFNDSQNVAYKILTTIAEATGLDIVLYKSEVNANGDFEGAQGRFKWSEDKLYIDINAGLKSIDSVDKLTKYAMLRTFSHEFTHFIEKWNPVWYNEFRKVVFAELTARGENVHDLIEDKMAANPGMSYDKASREVVAEAMTDILPDSHFVETLANKHKNIFEKLLAKLKEFLADIKAYFKAIVHNPSREANALKEQVGDAVHYVESIVELFDKVAVEAVENYQATVDSQNTVNTNLQYIAKNQNNSIIKGDIADGTDQTERRNNGQAYENGARGNERRPKTDRDGRELSEKVRGEQTNSQKKGSSLRKRQLELNSSEKVFSEDSYISSNPGSVEEAEGKNLDEYGIEWYVVKKEKWDKPGVAGAANGRVYMREEIDESFRGIIARHEATHVMRQFKFKPYLDFLERTPEMLNISEPETRAFIEEMASDYNIDPFNIDNGSLQIIYDEINAYLYGEYAIDNDSEYLNYVDKIVYDYNEYIDELSQIHERFKAERKGVDEDTVQEQSRDYLKDHYPTIGVHWGVEDGILSIADARVVWKAIAEITKESYKYRKTVDGDYFIESEQALMIVGANYRYPMVKTIYKFKDNDSYAKEIIINAKGIKQQVREAESIIEVVYGEGHATRYDIEDSSSYGRKNGRGKGTNSGTHNSRTAIREWRFDDEGNEISRSYAENVQEQSRDYLEADTNQTNQNYGGDNYANLDNGGNGRRNTAEYAQRQVGGSSKDVSMADRNGGQGRRFTLGSGEALLSTDSEGVSVRITDASKLSNTSIKDEQGRLIALYHATDVDFDVFAKGDIGFHFGTLRQAQKRAADKKIGMPRFIRAYLNIKNPIESPRDTMSWNAHATALNLWSLGILTDTERAELNALYKQNDNGYNSKEAIRLREILESKGYDGIVYPNSFEGDEFSYIAFRNEQIVRAEKSSEEEQYQQRSEGLTDREVLELAANEVKVSDLSQAENDALTIFQDRLANLKDLQKKRAEQGRLYKEQQFGAKPDRAEASKTLNRMKILDEQIKKATADVLTVEEKEVLKRVLNKARKVVEEKERQHGREILNRWRDRRNNAAAIKKYRDRLRGDVDELTNWIIGPNNKDIAKHVPDVLKNSVIPFLSSINFMSKRSLKGGNATVSDKEFIKRLNALQSAIKINIDVYGMYSGYNDLPADFIEKLQHFVNTANVLLEKSAGEFIINQMTSAEIKELSQIVRTLKKYITQFNRFHNNAMYQHVYEAGDNSIDFLKELDNAGVHTGGFSNFVFWQQIRPAYAFERFGEGGKAIYDGLRQGLAKLAFNTKEIVSFTEKAYTAKEVKAWENELKEFSLGNDIVKIPVANIMSFYELTKDPEAKAHIDGDGIRVATYTRKGKKISDVGHILTVGEFNQIIGSLTDRQREVADALQKFMAEQGGKWGNYVSVARFGEELFTNPHYFPINSDGRHLSATVEEHPSAAALYALLNMSFTKSRKEGANNRIVLYSIFDVFANHMASMAQYNAMALPILDALKWFNYQQVFIDDEGNKTVTASVREQMSRVYGVPEETKPGSGKQGYAETFIVNIIKSFNGTAAQGTPYDTLGLKSLHAYNIAQVAYNLRVFVQQPLAITRAGMLLSFRSILKGFKLKPSKVKQNIEEMQKYSGIAAWKSLGFYDVNISRGLTHLIKHDTGVLEKIANVGMWGAEKADLMTWAAIWGAAKAEVTRTQHLTPESEGFYEAVTKLFDDVIYKTQVVDSILTKNEFMRDKGTFARLVGSFMSEATTNASMLIDAVDKYHLDMKRGMSKRDAWQKNKRYIGRTLYVFGVGAVLLAAVQAVIDAARDDDEYEEYYEKWLEQFGGNLIDELMPFNKLPIISDFYDLAKSLLSAVGVDTYGNPPSSVFMQWYDSLVKGTEIIYDKISGEDTNYTWYGGIYKLLQAVSGMSGLPLGSATREIITFWNNIAGVMAPSLKVKTYESSELSQIKYAYEDGYLSYEEAVNLLLEKGLADNENEAYFIISGWEAGEGYSKYDAIFDAVRNGGDFNAAMDELNSHGYSEKEVLSQVKSKIGEWYQGGEISKSQAENMLRKYSDMNSDEITATVNKWSSYVVTGIKYEDIDDEYMEGNITASRAIDMYVRYGSMTREKATEKVTVLEFVKENPSAEGISYSAVSAYKQYCEPNGVPAKIYYEAWKHKNTLSGSVKESMMAYINSLSLSARQKDSLYFAFEYAESKLYEAPWR